MLAQSLMHLQGDVSKHWTDKEIKPDHNSTYENMGQTVVSVSLFSLATFGFGGQVIAPKCPTFLSCKPL